MEHSNRKIRSLRENFRKSSWPGLLTVLFFTLLVFAPVCQLQFSPIDDVTNIYRNVYIQDPAAQNAGYFWTHPYNYLYMPLTYSLWALCARIAPLTTPQPLPLMHAASILNPFVFHALNLCVHIGSAGFVFAILLRLGFRAWPSVCGALLFALHPTQVESVAWITGLNNVLSGFFCLMGLYFYLRGVSPLTPVAFLEGTIEDPKRATSYKHPWIFPCLSTLCFLCALLAKPTATILPFCIVILESVAFRRPVRRWVGLVALWCLPAIACIAVTRFASQQNSDFFWYPFWARPFVAGDALSFYLVKLAFPIHLTFDYGRSPSFVMHFWWGYVDWLLPATLAVVLWRMARRSGTSREGTRLWLWVAYLLFIAGLLSVLGLVPFYWQPNSTVSDRYLYLAMLGPAIAVTALLSQVSNRSARAAGLIAGAVLLALSSRAVLQEYVWTSPYSLLTNMMQEAPNTAFAQHLYWGILTYEGDYAAALPHLLLSIHLEGVESATNDQDLAYTLIRLHRYLEALPPLDGAITLEPFNNEHWEWLWFALSHAQPSDEVEAFMQRRLLANPHDGRAEFALGLIQMQRESPIAALPKLEAGARDAPEESDLQYRLGVVLDHLQRYPEAEAQYRRALVDDPASQRARAALAGLRPHVRQ